MLTAAFGTGMRCIIATATHVTDANTFTAKADSPYAWGHAACNDQGTEYNVRLMGIEAPTGDECYAQEATDYLTTLLEGKRVCLMPDMGDNQSSAELSAYVWVSTDPSQRGCDDFANAEMVWQGYARVVESDQNGFQNGLTQRILKVLECQAYVFGRGMWGACDVPAPEGCGAEPTPTPESTATPAPAESTATPTPAEGTATPDGTPYSQARNCVEGKPCGDRCIPLYRRCEQPPG
jgi:endonuclease YncB( thermonuclease family)